MNSFPRQPHRVLIVGAKFGELYLNAFLHSPPGVELAGLLAQGSARAQQLAQAFGIPLYTRLEQVPDEIDIACIVVRSTVVAGQGTGLARACLERGMHVIQEHPVHPTEIASLLDIAQQHHCQYWINSFYPSTPAGQCWINDAQTIQQQLGQTPQSAQLTTSRQLLYSTLDLWLQATAVHAVTVESPAREEQIEVELLDDGDPHFHLLRLRRRESTATLHLQRYLDPDDPDLHSLVMHRHTLNWPEGYLSLEASYGPVLWTSSLSLPEHQHHSRSLYQLSAMSEGHTLHTPITQIRCPAPKAGGIASSLTDLLVLPHSCRNFASLSPTGNICPGTGPSPAGHCHTVAKNSAMCRSGTGATLAGTKSVGPELVQMRR
ncbi:Gfo/Idh/MocA family oxidoreductase [Vibrio sp. PP-XX7]